MDPFRTSLLVAVLAAATQAQAPALVGPLPVGVRSVAWTNASPLGSPSLLATVHYPAAIAGADVPVLSHPTGWPVVVFLHGFGWFGSDYGALATRWAEAGFVVVASDTCQWDWVCQEHDGRALHAAVLAADADAQSPFFGAFDETRVAVAGHSMGGSSVGNILVANPGYRCGFTFAPVTPLVDPTPIAVPFGIVVGTADAITPWDSYALPYFNATGFDALKFLYLLNADCDHMNLAGLVQPPWSPQTQAVFDRATKVGRGFLQHAMQVEATGLEVAIGSDALAEPRLVSLQRAVSVPQMWTNRALMIGGLTRVSTAVEGTFGLLMAASGVIPPVATPFGLLAIDPSTAFPVGLGIANAAGCVDTVLQVPADPLLIGLPVALQVLADGAGQLWLSNAWLFLVQA